MKISGVDIRPGNIIEYEGGIWRAVKIQHTQPGKGGAYMQVELKNLIDGRKNNVRFRSAETVERVRLDTKDFQFLFARRRHADLHGQGNLRADQPARGPARRRRGLPPGRHGRGHGAVRRAADLGAIARHDRGDDRRGRRGGEGPDRASSSYKPAMLDNGVRVMVPPHIGARHAGSSSTSTSRHMSGAPTRPMVSHSGLITVMQRAARKAAPRLRRDFGEVEQLQVSRKGPADFVSMADKRAEADARRGTAQRAARLGHAARGRRRDRGQSGQAALDRRSARRHHQLPPRRARISRSRSRSRSKKPGGEPRDHPRRWSTSR